MLLGTPFEPIKRVLIGRPLRTEEAPHQAVSNPVGLAVFASDALSSTAYATQEILIVLASAFAVAGVGVFRISIPIAIAITLVLGVLIISYRQTIKAYNGASCGAYVVARDNLGVFPSQIAGAALLVDYVLTVAVSISSGVDQVASAIPVLRGREVLVAIAAILIMTLINLRGVKESGRIFAVPTYFFVGMTLLTLVTGAFKFFTGQLTPVENVHMVTHTTEPLSLFLILYAFSSGCTALTGIEAISDGVQNFKEPRGKNAALTISVMGLLLGSLFMGITLLANQVQALPSEEETIISQIARAVFGSGMLYGLQITATTIILIMAANTAYADFPRIAAFVAGDSFLPRQLAIRGSRLVYSGGILTLAVAASVLIIVFNARTTSLIPLYAIGVFMCFTLSQSGMVRRWLEVSKLKPGESVKMGQSMAAYDPRWRRNLIINGAGAVLSLVVLVIFAITKFTHGAWITLLVIPAMVLVFHRVHKHYRDVARILSLSKERVKPTPHPVRTIVLVDDVHRGTVRVVDFAKSLGHPWTPVHVDYNDRKTHIVQQKWRERIGEGELVILPSPYRRLVEPIVDYVKAELEKDPNLFVHVIMGQLVMDTPWARALHSNNALGIMSALQAIDRVIVTDVPYQLHGEDVELYPENEPESYEQMKEREQQQKRQRGDETIESGIG
ncbi:MAG: APC family permease [Thermoflexales bacterium]|nr:APC family permease [Thermoflexales bacterium]MDW8352263.1 APC family permease [Anaerolineae bacterium]